MSKPFKLSSADITAIRTAERRFGSMKLPFTVPAAQSLFVVGLASSETSHNRQKLCAFDVRNEFRDAMHSLTESQK